MTELVVKVVITTVILSMIAYFISAIFLLANYWGLIGYLKRFYNRRWRELKGELKIVKRANRLYLWNYISGDMDNDDPKIVGYKKRIKVGLFLSLGTFSIPVILMLIMVIVVHFTVGFN